MSAPKSRFLAPLALVAAFAVAPVVHADDPSTTVVVTASALRAEMASKYAEGLQLRARGDSYGAFLAFYEAGQMGHPKAQRRLGEIYDAGDAFVKRDYAKSLRWYQAAREQGEEVPTAKGRAYVLVR